MSRLEWDSHRDYLLAQSICRNFRENGYLTVQNGKSVCNLSEDVGYVEIEERRSRYEHLMEDKDD